MYNTESFLLIVTQLLTIRNWELSGSREFCIGIFQSTLGDCLQERPPSGCRIFENCMQGEQIHDKFGMDSQGAITQEHGEEFGSDTVKLVKDVSHMADEGQMRSTQVLHQLFEFNVFYFQRKGLECGSRLACKADRFGFFVIDRHVPPSPVQEYV